MPPSWRWPQVLPGSHRQDGIWPPLCCRSSCAVPTPTGCSGNSEDIPSEPFVHLHGQRLQGRRQAEIGICIVHSWDAYHSEQFSLSYLRDNNPCPARPAATFRPPNTTATLWPLFECDAARWSATEAVCSPGFALCSVGRWLARPISLWFAAAPPGRLCVVHNSPNSRRRSPQ